MHEMPPFAEGVEQGAGEELKMSTTPPIFIHGGFLPSLESLHGWRSQYERIYRWHGKLKTEGDLDSYISFFVNCHALKDWLEQCGEFAKGELDALMDGDWYMSLCRDLCNRSKHLVIDRRVSVDRNWSICLEYRGADNPSEMVVLAGGKKVDLAVLPGACLAFWKRVLAERGLLDSDTVP